MTEKPLVIIGAGGHGRVVAEAAGLAGYTISGFLGCDKSSSSIDLLGDDTQLEDPSFLSSHHFILAIGDLRLREEWLKKTHSYALDFATIIHPAAYVSPSAELGEGVYVGPKAVAHSHAVINNHSIINTAALVEHDCRLGVSCHIAPGAVLTGGVELGDFVLVGANAVVLPQSSIPAHQMIKANSVEK